MKIMMNIHDYFLNFMGLSGVGKSDSLRYFLWFDKDYALDWGWMALANDPDYIFTHVTTQKVPPIEFPRSTYKGCMYDPYVTVYVYKGLMGKHGYSVTLPPSQDFWDRYGK